MNSTGSQPQSQSQSQGSHSLAFRVMRLCKPSFHVDPPLRLDLSDLIAGEDIFDDPIAASNLTPLLDRHVANPTDSSDLSYRTRFLLHDSSDPMGLSSLLVLPQSFGWVSLSLSLALNFGFWFLIWRNLIWTGRYTWERHFVAILALTTAPTSKLRMLLSRFLLPISLDYSFLITTKWIASYWAVVYLFWYHYNLKRVVQWLHDVVDFRLKFKRRGRGYCFWIPQNRLLNRYVLEAVMISLLNMMWRNSDLTRKLSYICWFRFWHNFI